MVSPSTQIIRRDSLGFYAFIAPMGKTGAPIHTGNVVFGNRIEKAVDDDGDSTVDWTERYAYDGWRPGGGFIGNENWDIWADLDGDNSNALKTRYVRGDAIDEVFGRIESDDSIYWLLTDRLGSVRDVPNNSGVVKDTIAYDGFGGITSETDSSFRGRYAWTGRELDVETELQHNRRRYYDATIGRWTSQDPLGFGAGDSNLYRYVINQPMVKADASGLAPPEYLYNIPDPRSMVTRNLYPNPWSKKSLPKTHPLQPNPWSAISTPYDRIRPSTQKSPVFKDGVVRYMPLSAHPALPWSVRIGAGEVTEHEFATRLDELDHLARTRILTNAELVEWIALGRQDLRRNLKITGVETIKSPWAHIREKQPDAYMFLSPLRVYLPESPPDTIIHYEDGSRTVLLGGGPSSADLANQAIAILAVVPTPRTTGQIHHPISTRVHRALERHPNLRGHYQARDPRFTTRALNEEAHRGWQGWHRELDREVADWILDPDNGTVTPQQFEEWLRQRYSQPDLQWRFPDGF